MARAGCPGRPPNRDGHLRLCALSNAPENAPPQKELCMRAEQCADAPGRGLFPPRAFCTLSSGQRSFSERERPRPSPKNLFEPPSSSLRSEEHTSELQSQFHLLFPL